MKKKKSGIVLGVVITIAILIIGIAVFIMSNNNLDISKKEDNLKWQNNVSSKTEEELTDGYYIKHDGKFYPLKDMEDVIENNGTIATMQDYRSKSAYDVRLYGLYGIYMIKEDYDNLLPHINMQDEDDKLVYVGEELPKMVLLKTMQDAGMGLLGICINSDTKEVISVSDKELVNEDIVGYTVELKSKNLKTNGIFIETTAGGPYELIFTKGTKRKEITIENKSTIASVLLGTYTNDYTVTNNGYMEVNFNREHCANGIYIVNDKAFIIEQNDSNIENIILNDMREQTKLAPILYQISNGREELTQISSGTIMAHEYTAYLTIKKGTLIYEVETNDGLLGALRNNDKIKPTQIKLPKDHVTILTGGAFQTWEDQISTKIVGDTRYYFLPNVNGAYAIKAKDYYQILSDSIMSNNLKLY